LYPDFANRPDSKSTGLNPGDSVNPNTTKFLLFLKDCNYSGERPDALDLSKIVLPKISHSRTKASGR
jgi:hypothetical protein